MMVTTIEGDASRCSEAETERPDANDDSTLYFGPGEHWVDSIKVRSGQTVYIVG